MSSWARIDLSASSSCKKLLMNSSLPKSKFFRTASRFAEFDTTELTRANTAELFAAYRTAIGTAGAPGFMTPDEVRQKLNMKKTAGGDVLFSGVVPQAPGAANAP